MTPASAPRFSRSPYLVELVVEVERLAAAVAAAPVPDRAALALEQLPRAVLASLQLDGSRRTDVPDEATLAAARGTVATVEATSRRKGTWFDAMRTFDEDEHDAQLHALEFDGTTQALTDHDLAESLLSDPVPTLAALHARLTRGLVAPERAGAVRTVEQAVHDAAVGRIIFFTTDPAAIAGELASLAGWLVSAGTREHGLIVSGVLHLELLRIHPFDAANGRLARVAARLLLRVRGLDPDGLAVPETALVEDPVGYHEEVARTLRRRDLTIWLERWAEAVADGLRSSARTLGQLPTTPPDRAAAFLEGWDDDAFTVADYRAAAAVGPEDTRADLQLLLDAGRVTRVPGSRGLRFTRRDA